MENTTLTDRASVPTVREQEREVSNDRNVDRVGNMDGSKRVASHDPDISTPDRVGAALYDGLTSSIGDQRRTANTITGLVNSDQLGSWNIRPETFEKIPGWLMDAAHAARAQGDIRTLTSLTKALSALADHNLRRAEGLDKATRLDEGSATENYTFGAIKFSGDKQLRQARAPEQVDHPDGSHAGMEPDSMPPTTQSDISVIPPLGGGDF